MTQLTSIVGAPGDLYVWDAHGGSGRAILGVTNQPLVARLRLVAAMLSLPESPTYGAIRTARLDPLGPPSYVYGPVLIRVRRTAGGIEVADE